MAFSGIPGQIILGQFVLGDTGVFVPPPTPITRAVSDSISLSDSVAVDPNDTSHNSFTDSISLSDSISVSIGSLGAYLVSDQIILSDSVATAIFNPSTPANVLVTQDLIEVAPHLEQSHNPPNILVTQDAVEWVRHKGAGDINILVTQDAIEFLFHPPDHILCTQTCIEVARKPINVPVKAHYKRIEPVRK